MDNFDEDLAMEEWMAMTDQQQEAILDREIKAHAEWFDSLPLKTQTAISRRRTPESIMSWRRMMRDNPLMDIGMNYLRQGQRRLLKLRIWRATGVYPGEA
jgi:hypothetical protein